VSADHCYCSAVSELTAHKGKGILLLAEGNEIEAEEGTRKIKSQE